MGDWFTGSSSQATFVPTQYPLQQEFLDQIARMASTQAGGGMGGNTAYYNRFYGYNQPQGIPSYPGQITPGLNQWQQQGLNQIGQAIPTQYGQGMNALGTILNPQDNMTYWNQAFEPMQEQIANRFAAVDGARSSGMMEAMGRGYGQAIIPQVMNQQQAALGMLPGMTMLPQQYGMAQLAGGEVPWNIGLQQGQESYNKWLMSQPYNNPWLSRGLQAAGIPMLESGIVGGTPGLMGGLSQGLGTAGGMWGMSQLLGK